MDYTVYARLMTSHGSKYKEPATGLPMPRVAGANNDVLDYQETPLGEGDY
jgi:hypothetical protein